MGCWTLACGFAWINWQNIFARNFQKVFPNSSMETQLIRNIRTLRRHHRLLRAVYGHQGPSRSSLCSLRRHYLPCWCWESNLLTLPQAEQLLDSLTPVSCQLMPIIVLGACSNCSIFWFSNARIQRRKISSKYWFLIRREDLHGRTLL